MNPKIKNDISQQVQQLLILNQTLCKYRGENQTISEEDYPTLNKASWAWSKARATDELSTAKANIQEALTQFTLFKKKLSNPPELINIPEVQKTVADMETVLITLQKITHAP